MSDREVSLPVLNGYGNTDSMSVARGPAGAIFFKAGVTSLKVDSNFISPGEVRKLRWELPFLFGRSIEPKSMLHLNHPTS